MADARNLPDSCLCYNPLSLYVVHSQVLGLATRPFPSKAGIRGRWNSIFQDKKCFSHKAAQAGRRGDVDSLASAPFLRRLGAVCLDTEHVREAFALNKYRGLNVDDLSDTKFFGASGKYRGDERLSHLYFELRRPLSLAASPKGLRLRPVSAKLFVHIYPVGYVVLKLAVSLAFKGWNHTDNPEDCTIGLLRQLFDETKPWGERGDWTWKCSIKTGTLPEIMTVIKNELQRSFYSDTSRKFSEGSWESAVKIGSPSTKMALTGRTIAINVLFRNKEFESFDILDDWGHNKRLLASRQAIACVFSPRTARRLSIKFFWKFLVLAELVQLKRRIYEDYIQFFKEQMNELREFRLSLRRKATKEDVFRFSVYDPQIPRLFLVLDQHIRATKPFYRRIYSMLSTGTGLDARRARAATLVRDWQDEVEKWEPVLVVLWKKIIAPLRSLLAPTGSR